jgi:hypothetical protein
MLAFNLPPAKLAAGFIWLQTIHPTVPKPGANLFSRSIYQEGKAS